MTVNRSAEYERSLIQERTEAGLAAARTRGRFPGRPTVMTPDRIATAKGLIASATPISQVAATLGVGRSSIYRALEGSKWQLTMRRGSKVSFVGCMNLKRTRTR